MAMQAHRQFGNLGAPAPHIDAQIASALEDAGPTIAEWSDVQKRLAKLAPGTTAHAADGAYARDLYDQIDRRARRIELEDGAELTGEGLIAFARVEQSARLRQPANPARATVRALHQELIIAAARTAAAAAGVTTAKAELADAERAERAAREALRAHGAGALVLR